MNGPRQVGALTGAATHTDEMDRLRAELAGVEARSFRGDPSIGLTWDELWARIAARQAEGCSASTARCRPARLESVT